MNLNGSQNGAHSSFFSDTLGIHSRYWKGQRVAFTQPGLLFDPGFLWSWVFCNLSSFLFISKVLCFASIAWVVYYAFSVVAPLGGMLEASERVGWKRKTLEIWMATRIASETETVNDELNSLDGSQVSVFENNWFCKWVRVLICQLFEELFLP